MRKVLAFLFLIIVLLITTAPLLVCTGCASWDTPVGKVEVSLWDVIVDVIGGVRHVKVTPTTQPATTQPGV